MYSVFLFLLDLNVFRKFGPPPAFYRGGAFDRRDKNNLCLWLLFEIVKKHFSRPRLTECGARGIIKKAMSGQSRFMGRA